MFSAIFDKQDKDDQILDEIELISNLNNFPKITQKDIDNFDIETQLERQIQHQELKDSSWKFDKNYFSDNISP